LRSGILGRSARAFALAAAVLSGGCIYGFHGGGLPSDIRTVAVLPFDNHTGEPALTQEVTQAVQQAVENQLGLRDAAEANADAIVRGEITSYTPDVPLSYQATQGVVNVTRRQVQIVVNVEIFDQKQGRTLWKQSGLSVSGEYQPPAETDGRRTALAKLQTQVVEGAQSQW